MGIEWQLHDAKRDRVVYKVMTDAFVVDLTSGQFQHQTPDGYGANARCVRAL